MSVLRQATYAFSVANLAIGIARFAGPLVRVNRERVLNIALGFLFGVFAMNWLHALLQLLVGLLGLPAGATSGSARGYMRLQAALFAPCPRWAGRRRGGLGSTWLWAW